MALALPGAQNIIGNIQLALPNKQGMGIALKKMSTSILNRFQMVIRQCIKKDHSDRGTNPTTALMHSIDQVFRPLDLADNKFCQEPVSVKNSTKETVPGPKSN